MSKCIKSIKTRLDMRSRVPNTYKKENIHKKNKKKENIHKQIKKKRKYSPKKCSCPQAPVIST